MTQACIKIDNINGMWTQTGTCGLEYDLFLPDSRIYYQDISISNLTFNIQVHSSRSPAEIYKDVTRGLGKLDDEPAREKTAAIILLCGAIPMLLLSLYKTYRFCVKYTLADWLRKRKMKRYEASDDADIVYFGEDAVSLKQDRGSPPLDSKTQNHP